jgi:molybdenum cofactor biosynthesis enzyme MoaA
MQDKKIIAIRSLLCPDHAHNIPPKVLAISWFLGKRCNYDCSYCSLHTHDAVSPFVGQDTAMGFASQILNFAEANNKKIKWSFTGGEPFIDPGFVPLVKMINGHASTEQINVTTNGSVPLKVYTDCEKIFAGITISLHLERSHSEIKKTINKIIYLNKNTNMFINVNLMFLPGQQTQVEQIIQKFNTHNVKFVLRKILNHDQAVEDSHAFYDLATNKKDRVLIPVVDQSIRKINWRKNNNSVLEINNLNYYTKSEMQFLESTNKKIIWNNMGAWYLDGTYEELNTDYLLTKEIPNFEGWTCFAGVDQLAVDFDGSVYIGQCQNGGAVGHISDKKTTFLSAPGICITKHCNCNTDIPVRKSKNNFEHLIGMNTNTN